MSSANSASRTVEFAIGKAIAWMAVVEDIRKDDRASPNKMKRNGANWQPCQTDLEIGNNVPLPPENKTELDACLYNADTSFIHALGNPNLDRTASRKSQYTLSYAFSKSNNSIARDFSWCWANALVSQKRKILSKMIAPMQSSGGDYSYYEFVIS